MSGTEKTGAAAVLVALVLAVALLALVATTRPAEAAGRYKTVTKTFSNPASIVFPPDIGEASPYPSEIGVSGLRRGKILDANLTLEGFGHLWPDDAAVLLVGPRGQGMVAMGDTGGRFSTFNAELVLDDEAPDFLPDSNLITSGSYKPTRGSSGPDGMPTPQNFFSPAPVGPYASTLSYLDGTNPNGTWKLYVLDDSFGAAGAIEGGWSVEIKARVLR